MRYILPDIGDLLGLAPPLVKAPAFGQLPADVSAPWQGPGRRSVVSCADPGSGLAECLSDEPRIRQLIGEGEER